RRLEDVLQGGQPLFLFGERAGVLEIEAFGETWFAALAYTADKRFGAIAMVPSAAVFSEWRRGVTLNVTLFVMTATLICIILYASFAQVSRAEAADRLYLPAHERINLALARGRCGLWDWDMSRGWMYWSPSMYEMLGYEPSDAMLSL